MMSKGTGFLLRGILETEPPAKDIIIKTEGMQLDTIITYRLK